MIFRVLTFLALLFALTMSIVYGLKLPVDGLLLFLSLLLPIVTGLFSHYRYVGRLRTGGQYDTALKQFSFWWLLLPSESYQQMRIQLLIEAGRNREAENSITRAQKSGMSQAYTAGLRADIQRRQGQHQSAKHTLQQALNQCPPNILRTGLLAQLARLYSQHLPSKQHLKETGFLLDEADSISPEAPYKYLLNAIRGEWFLARNQPKKAATLLQNSLDALIKKAPPNPTILQKIGRIFAQLTYSHQDEHQYPFFAELHISLARAYKKLGQHQNASRTIKRGLSLCQQDFVAKALRAENKHLP